MLAAQQPATPSKTRAGGHQRRVAPHAGPGPHRARGRVPCHYTFACPGNVSGPVFLGASPARRLSSSLAGPGCDGWPRLRPTRRHQDPAVPALSHRMISRTDGIGGRATDVLRGVLGSRSRSEPEGPGGFSPASSRRPPGSAPRRTDPQFPSPACSAAVLYPHPPGHLTHLAHGRVPQQSSTNRIWLAGTSWSPPGRPSDPACRR